MSLGFLRTRRHPERIQELREIMHRHRLTRADLCRILGLTPSRPAGSHGTVDGWFAYRHAMPEHALQKIRDAAPTYERPPLPTAE